MKNAEIIRSSRALARLRTTARDAVRAVRALEQAAGDTDVFGRYLIAAGERIDEDEVFQFLHLAREMHPYQELCIVVTAQMSADKEAGNGKSEGVRRGSEDR